VGFDSVELEDSRTGIGELIDGLGCDCGVVGGAEAGICSIACCTASGCLSSGVLAMSSFSGFSVLPKANIGV
jgi:hypothetical protein